MRRSHAIVLLLLVLLAVTVEAIRYHGDVQCFSTVSVNVSGVKPPIVSGPGFPPWARFKGVAVDEIVNGSPMHVLAGIFNFEPSNWTKKRPTCYFKALEGFSENWTGLILPGVSPSNITLSGRVYLALYVYPKETSIIISKLKYGETPEESRITEAFRLDYPQSPGKYIDDYVNSLEGSGYHRVKALPNGVLFKKGRNFLLVLETKDSANIYLLVAEGGEGDVLKITG
ncbi:hypothetical protein [Thermococcus sp.]|uniref:hypothetical protein n=1 Tax=Thermococcus sp. TaxID=35749 RepID=UPI00261B5C69|nr:hypothetical protein [Thermococcus sp.]